MTGQEFWEFILKSNIINFTIMISVLVWIFKKFNLQKFIDAMAKDVEKSVFESGEAVKSALEDYKKTNRELKNIDEKRRAIIENANETALKTAEKAQSDIKLKLDELDKNKAKTADILFERKKGKTADDIKQAVCVLTKEVIQEKVDDNLHFELVKNALDELDDIDLIRGRG